MTQESLFDCFDRIVASHAQRVAVKSGSRAFTYRDLDICSSQIGRYLFAHLRSGSRPVAVLMDNPAEVVVALLGILRSGNFYSILSPRNPAARLSAILGDLDAPVVIADAVFAQLAQQAAPADCSVIRFEEMNADSSEPFECPVSDDQLIGIYYTSGSTGEPKGVMRQRSTVVQRALREIESLGLTPQDNVLLTHLLSGTASLSTVFSALLSGGSLLIYEPDKLGVAPLKDYAINEKITIFRITVELLRYFVDSLPVGTLFSDIRVFMSAGDVLYRRDLERIWKHLPPEAVFIHQLASSESSILARNVLRADSRLDSDIVPVGLPFEGQDVFLLDENRLPAPAGNVGEICLRSDWKFPGYWRRPDLTDDKLVPDPFNPGQKILSTGDLGRFRPDGQLEFIGRRDARVKIRGFSVDMAAVESVLMSAGGVRRAVVIPADTAYGRKRLVAYVSPMPGAELNTRALRQLAAENLTDYMIPSAFVILSDFPLTPTGKIDRKALPAPDWEELQPDGSHTQPANDTEKKLALLWQNALGLQKIGVHDNFFEIGGDSLAASALFVEVEREFGLRLPLSFIVENNTVRRMAAELQNPSGVRGLVALQPEGDKTPLFLVPGAYGDAMLWRALLPYIRPDRPMFSVQALRRDGEHLYKYSVEQVAQRFLEDIRAMRPSGPYLLMGYSFGGLIAFEMACQLEAKGESVSFLGVVDTSPPGSHREASVPDRLRIHWNNFSALHWQKRGQYITDGIKRLLIKLGRSQAIREAMPVQKLFPNDHRAATTLALRNYQPTRVYSGGLTVFKAMERPWYVRWDRMAEWSSHVAGQIAFHEIPGTHGTVMREPNIRLLGQALADALLSVND